jgi:hypothetical protein
MGRPRTDFQSVLEGLQEGTSVYFQPPSSLSLDYPAIVYNRDFGKTEFADNTPYVGTWRYLVIVMDRNPDSPLVDLMQKMPMTSYVRHFARDNLNHDVFYVYF